MATHEQLQATFDEFHRASAILKMRLANSPHSEQTEVQRRKVQALREKLLDQVYRQLGFDVKSTEPKRRRGIKSLSAMPERALNASVVGDKNAH